MKVWNPRQGNRGGFVDYASFPRLKEQYVITHYFL
jgi:hypothetical protein